MNLLSCQLGNGDPVRRRRAAARGARALCRFAGRFGEAMGGTRSRLTVPTRRRSEGCGRIKWAAAALLGVLLCCSPARAFPPAPPHRLYGLVRDQWGNPINVTGAQVFLETTNGPGVTVALAPRVEPGINYELLVPMDAGLTADVKPTALKPAFPFRLRVKIGQTTFLPIEMAMTAPRIGQPAQATRLDLTLGEDSDGDGLPDAW